MKIPKSMESFFQLLSHGGTRKAHPSGGGFTKASVMNTNPVKPEARDEDNPSLETTAADKSGALQADDTVQSAGEKMRSVNADVWPVAEERKLIGQVTDKYPDVQLSSEGHDPNTWRVGEIMDRHAHFCYERQGCVAALRLMEELDLDYLPIVDRDLRIVSIVSRKDLRRQKSSSSDR
jgi:CBS domain-containing protein